MNNSSLDYGKSLKDLLVQTLKFKRYHEFGLIPSIIFGVLLSPFFIIAGALSLAFVIIYSFFKIIAAPVDYLTAILHVEGKDVKHLTQFIIYFIGFPTVFLFNIILAFFSIFQFTLYLLISLCCQVCSLGGVEFRPFLNLSEYVERTDVPDLKNIDLNLKIKLCYLAGFIVLGILLEIINNSEGILPSGIFFVICYFLGAILMPFAFYQNDESNHHDEPKKVEEEPIEEAKDETPVEDKPVEAKPHKENVSKRNDLILKIALVATFILSFVGLILTIVTRVKYFYKDVAFNITLTFTIVNFLAFIILGIIFYLYYFKDKSKSPSHQSIAFKGTIAGLIFSCLVSIGGFVSSAIEFYPELESNNHHSYYGIYMCNEYGKQYEITIDEEFSVAIYEPGNLLKFEAPYYYGSAKYSKDVCGINNKCLFVDTTGKDLYDRYSHDLLFSKGKHITIEIGFDYIIVSPESWSLKLDKTFSSTII